MSEHTKLIYKYAFPLEAVSSRVGFHLPAGAKILSVGNQDESLCVWAVVDTSPGHLYEWRILAVAGTGHQPPLSDSAVFLGTVLFGGGQLVLHVFDMGCEP